LIKTTKNIYYQDRLAACV